MNLQQYSNCWSISQFCGISLSEIYKQAATQESQKYKIDQDKELLKQLKISSKLIEYILNICEENEFNNLTKNNTLLLIQKYVKIKNRNYDDDIQIVGLTCLNLSMKIFETNKQGAEFIYIYSNHNYKNSELLRMEQKILNEFDYLIDFRDELIADKIQLQLEMSESVIPIEYQLIVKETSFKILDILYEDPDTVDLYNYTISVHLLASSIIQCSFVVLTQQTGIFPITWRLSVLIKQDQDKIIIYSQKILKFILSKQVYKQLDF